MTNVDDLPETLKQLELFAWVGLDELGSDEYGIKRAYTPAGYIPLVSVSKIKVEMFKNSLNTQSKEYGKKIRLLRYKLVEVIYETDGAEG